MVGNSLAIMEVPLVVYTDESLMFQESHNKVLHDIITHKMDEGVTTVKQMTKGVSEVLPEVSFDDIVKEADLSPRLLKSSRRGKKQSHG